MVEEGTWFSWDPCILAHLYHDLHQFVYDGAASLSASVSLLQIWAWLHIAMTQPIGMGVRGHDRTYSYMSQEIIS